MTELRLRRGFTLVEVLVAVIILAFGLLAMAGATSVFFTQIQAADSNVERATAIEMALEWVRSTPFDSLQSTSEGDATVGDYDVWWNVETASAQLSRITVYTRGRGYIPGSGWSDEAVDSFVVSVARGMQPDF